MYSLSKPQKSIYNMEKFGGDSISVICGYAMFNDVYDLNLLEASLNELYRLNDALRMRIVESAGEVSQYVSEFEYKKIEVLHFSSKDELEEYVRNFAKEPMDLSGSLFDVKIAVCRGQMGAISKLHHIVGDAWSCSVMETQLRQILKGITPEAFSYLDYLEKEKEYLNSKRYQRDLQYFENQIKQCEKITLLSEKQAKSLEAKRKTFTIDKNKTKLIADYAAKNNSTVYSVFMNVISVYISRVKDNAERFFIGTPVLNRTSHKDMNTVGTFINTVPFPVTLDSEKTFSQNLGITTENSIDIFRHERFNYSDLLEKYRNAFIFGDKLYDVAFSYQNVKVKDFEKMSQWFSCGMQPESLQIHIYDRNDEGYYTVDYDYQTEKFSDSEIERMHGHIFNLLFDAIENDSKKLYELNLLSNEEKEILLNKFNNTTADYPKEKCIHELFEEQAEKTPDKVALVFSDEKFTFFEINSMANALAEELKKSGVKHGDIVGIIAKRSYRIVVAILAVFKVGAAYLPIDYNYPKNRIDTIVDDSDCKVVLTHGVDYQSDRSVAIPEIIPAVKDNIQSVGKPDDVCGIIYTSGSTGKPKGTLLTHRGLVNYTFGNNALYEGGSCNIGFATYTFDAFFLDTIPPMIRGGIAVLSTENEQYNQTDFENLIKKNPGANIFITPAKLKQFIDNARDTRFFENIHSICIGGEVFPNEFINLFSKNTNVYNVYGPTECSMWMLEFPITGKDVALGKPLSNVQVYIVDTHLNPVPIGVTGELCIAGDGVGAGYLNRPELTAEKFVDNPFGEGKLYKTGDLAYWREDGNIVYVGRNDFQVKIRGLRIELGEIENAISAVEGINQSVVVVRKSKENRQLICAFYTGKETKTSEIRKSIGEKLPKYMLPHIFTHIDEMPLTSSGKINRNILPEVDLENIESTVEYVAPSTEKELALAKAIAEVLNVEKVSVLDNFFDIGGDSLKAIELTGKLGLKGYKVDVKTIFNCNSVKELAEKLDKNETEESYVDYGSVLPATAAQMRIYTAQSMDSGSTLYNVPFAFKTENLDAEKLQISVNSLIERHESLRTHFENRNGEIVQVIDKPKTIFVEKLSSEDILSFVKPFDLSNSPLVRVGYYENTVMIDLHHIIADGGALPIFFKELNELYMERAVEKTPVQYGEFAAMAVDLSESESYWLSVFDSEIPVLEMNTDYPRAEKQSFNGSAVYDLIDIETQKKIVEKCKALGITLYAFYMAAFNILLSKYSGNEDVVVGTPFSGRTPKYLETIGMFVNTVAFRNRPEGNKTTNDFLLEVKENLINAMANCNYPLGELVKKLGLKITNRNPLFDVMFAYQREDMTDVVFGDKKVEVLPIPVTASKCDFTLNILPRKNDVVVMAEYCVDLYKKETVQKLINSFKKILNEILEENILLKDITAIDEAEKQKLLCDFNDTVAAYPQDKSIYELFENSVAGRENSVCIETAERAITFGAFKKAVESLDFAIGKKTEGKNNVIAIIANRSVEMYIAIYAAIRGGNAYMPILPDYPEDRIGFMLKDSNAALVLAQSEFKSSAGDLPCIDISAFDYGKVDDSPRACNSSPDDAAYVIYTSGSTGTPKGSIISNKSAINRILWMQKAYSLDENSVILQKTPYTFDVSVWELFWWGISKGHLAPMKPDGHFMPAEILEDCKRYSVTHLHFVPSVFDLFVSFLELHGEKLKSLDSVKHIFLSGEALSAELVNRFYALLPDSSIKLHNLYGPTECAVDVTYYDCKKEETNPVPIGKPIDNTQIYIVDGYMNIVPAEVQGELCIGGANVGMGYLNRPELTAQKFVDNPFGEGKLYKTGDLAYWRDDGEIVFCGRKDFQVKLNGQRVELGEIEAVILQYKAITSAAVVLRKHKEKDILVAFYSGEETSGNELKAFCREKLPSYMVPSGFARLEKLPLNSSGKLDRKQLSAIELPSFELTQKLEAPIDETEKLICDAFRAVLKADKIDRNTDFYDAGGTSLDTIRLLYDDSFSGITASDLMVNSTPAKLAAFLKKRTASSFKYLQRLVVNENSKKAIILFPFAGGSSAAFSALTHELNEIVDSLSLYAVDYPKNSQDCKEIAEEIIQLSQVSEISFYAHCAGVSIALQVAEIIEKSDKSVVKSFIAGGNIPFEKPMKFNVWSAVPYPFITAFLKKAGSVLTELPKEIQKKSLEDFRRHTTFAYEYFRVPGHKINAPIYVIISKEDLFTRNYKDAERNWSIYTNGPVSVDFIEGKSHYFQSDKPKELAKMIADIIG